MTKSLTRLFFSTAKRLARLQRQAIKIANRAAPKKPRKTAAKRKPVKSMVSTARAVAPAGAGTWQNLIHQSAPSLGSLLGRLPYSLYRPAGRPIAGLPLVVMLHGCQQTAYEMAIGSRMNHLADSKGFVVVYPQQQKRFQAFGCWRWFKPDAVHGFAEADTIADLTRTLVLRHKLDRERVYVAGLSAGAGMAGFAALRHPRLFSAVAMHSGAVLGDAHSQAAGLQTMRRGALRDPGTLIKSVLKDPALFPGMPAIIIHGQRDHVVNPRNANQLAQQFVHVNWVIAGAQGLAAASQSGNDIAAKPGILAQGTVREYERHDFLRDKKPVVRLCLIKGLGHAWSGGDPKIKFNAKEGPKACLLIWQFFAKHKGSG